MNTFKYNFEVIAEDHLQLWKATIYCFFFLLTVIVYLIIMVQQCSTIQVGLLNIIVHLHSVFNSSLTLAFYVCAFL